MVNCRNDLKLWQAFAEIEWLSGNKEEARRVFDSTLLMAGEMFPEEQSRRMALVPLVRFDKTVTLILNNEAVFFHFSVKFIQTSLSSFFLGPMLSLKLASH